MTDFKSPASFILWHFLGAIDRLYGMYSDANLGFYLLGKMISEQCAPEAREARMFFGEGDPNRTDAHYVHSSKIQDLIDRNAKEGENARMLALSCIVFVYTIWDTNVRPKYAEALGLSLNDIRSELFGDLRHYRHAILHNDGILEKEAVSLQYFKVGDRISLSEQNMREIFSRVFDEIDTLSFRYTGDRFNLRFERRLNP